MSGSRAASSLAAIVARKEKLEEELRNVERQVGTQTGTGFLGLRVLVYEKDSMVVKTHQSLLLFYDVPIQLLFCRPVIIIGRFWKHALRREGSRRSIPLFPD